MITKSDCLGIIRFFFDNNKSVAVRRGAYSYQELRLDGYLLESVPEILGPYALTQWKD